jgi:ribonucleoside-triphosphate reductase
MRSLEVIDKELAAAREALSHTEGTPAEVYSRIVGYYRSVRNWNKGKKEEYGQRLMFNPSSRIEADAEDSADSSRLLLFVRPACPACPSAKAAAGKLGLPVDLVDADTEEGFAEAVRRQVMSTPTAILISESGKELGRARDPDSISRLIAV